MTNVKEILHTHPSANIRRLREEGNLSQLELSKRAGMSAAQLCKIERGCNELTSSTMRRIAEALGVPVSALLGERMPAGEVPNTTDNRNGNDGTSGLGDFMPVLSAQAAAESVLDELVNVESKISAEEERLGIVGQTALQLVYPYATDLQSAELLARDVRVSLGMGHQPMPDVARVLEGVGVRVITLRRSASFQSASFYNAARRVLVISLNAANTAERNAYRLAYELGGAVRFASAGYRTIADEGAEHRFLRDFAAAFLMPEAAVRGAVARLGLRPDSWTMQSLVYVKERFGVSAEAFALRLESLGLIAPSLRQKLRDELRARYKAHPRAMEPHPPKNQTCLDVLREIESKQFLRK